MSIVRREKENLDEVNEQLREKVGDLREELEDTRARVAARETEAFNRGKDEAERELKNRLLELGTFTNTGEGFAKFLYGVSTTECLDVHNQQHYKRLICRHEDAEELHADDLLAGDGALGPRD